MVILGNTGGYFPHNMHSWKTGYCGAEEDEKDI